MDTTARIIVNGEVDGTEMVKFRIRESVRDNPEDVILIKGREVDILRFESGSESTQFHIHKRDVTFHEKTLIVRTTDGREICRAGTGTKNKRGPFPI